MNVLDFALLPNDGRLLLLDNPLRLLKNETVIELPLEVEPGEPDTIMAFPHPTLRLHVSPSGRFAAIVHDHGETGVVVDLSTGQSTMDLDRGNDDVFPTRYPIAFLANDVLCHATTSNDIAYSDPATGETHLPEVQPTEDIYHGALHVSPTGKWIADDGWAWHPVGAPIVWEPHGPRNTEALCYPDLWNVEMCWIGDDLLAMAGLGDEEYGAVLDGVRIFDVTTNEQTVAFAGPRGHLFSDGTRLFSSSPDGLDIWDPATGQRTGQVPGFRPTRQGHGLLAALVDGEPVTWPM